MNMTTLPFSDILSLPRDQLVTVQAGLLQDLIGAYQSLKDEVAALREERAQDHREMAALTARATALESLQESEVSRLCCDIAQDRQRIAKLERPPEPRPAQKDRAEVLRALLIANNGKMLAADARKKMHLRKDLFSQLLNACGFIERKPLHSDKRKTILILKGELV